MIPKALIMTISDTDSIQFHSTWIGTHPDDNIQQGIFTYLTDHYDSDLSTIITIEGQLVYIKWFSQIQQGLVTLMTAYPSNLFKIGVLTYQWSQLLLFYHNIESPTTDQLSAILNQDHIEQLDTLSKHISRDWFDTAVSGGVFSLKLDNPDIHTYLGNILAFFPWVLFFTHESSITDTTLNLAVLINSELELAKDAIFDRLNGEFDEQFWQLLYQLVATLQSSDADMLYRILQATHEFTMVKQDPFNQLGTLTTYREFLPRLPVDYLRSYVQTMLFNTSTLPSTKELCDLLLDCASLLLEFDFTDMAKLTEATTLEHALRLSPEVKLEIILQLTQRSSIWGDQHLVSFIQSLTGLLPNDDDGREILSQVIDTVKDRLNQSWDGMLCIVEGKIIANRIADACELRFLATGMIGDKATRAEDIFASIIWSLQYDITAQRLYELASSYLDYAFNALSPESIIEQTDILTQRSLLSQRYEFLRYYFQYLRTHLHLIVSDYHRNVIHTLDLLLTDKRSYPLVFIEYLLLRIYALQYSNGSEDEVFQLVSQIFNHINPSLSSTAASLKYIASQIVKFGADTDNWAIIEETQRRYLLLSQDQSQALSALKTIYLQAALERSKLPGNQLHTSDIGIRLFSEGLQLSNLAEDYELVTKIIPRIKKMAIKSRSYSEYIQLLLQEIRLQKLTGENWVDSLAEDMNRIVGRVHLEEINDIFKQLFALDLTEEEEQHLIKVQLEFVETEPDLLTADEIYEKRLRLGRTQLDDPESVEFIIDNYQQGISELLSKGDTANLTNLLLEAINYCQDHNVEALTEFKDLLMDNFDNITQEFHSGESYEMYLYMLTIWRKVIDHFKETDLTIIVNFAMKLYRLNLLILRASDNNQYLRRAQLIMKELSLVVKDSPVYLEDEDTIMIYEELNQLFTHLRQKHLDFGVISAIQQAAVIYSNMNQSNALFTLLDEGITQIKREIHNDETAASSIFLLLLLLCEVGTQIDALDHPTLLEELTSRIKGVMNFALSLRLDQSVLKQLRVLQDQLYQSPQLFLNSYPHSLGNYIELSPEV